MDGWDISLNIPNKIHVDQNYPNPFNPITNIKYKLYKEEFVKVTVHDILVIWSIIYLIQGKHLVISYYNGTLLTTTEKSTCRNVFLYIEAGDFKKY